MAFHSPLAWVPLTGRLLLRIIGHMTKSNDQDNVGVRTSAERGRQVRTRLLEAGAELIGEVGWNAVRTRLVAQRAGVRPGLVHYHFESLQSLLRHAAIAEMSQVLGRFEAGFTEEPEAESGFEAMLAQLEGYDGTDPSSLLVIEAYLAARRDPLLSEQMKGITTGFRSALAGSLARSGHPSADSAATVVLALLDGLVLQKGLEPTIPMAEVSAYFRMIIAPDQQEHRI